MAKSLHLAASLADPSAFTAAMASQDDLVVAPSGRWMLASAPLWAVDGDALDRALATLPGPGLRVSIDGDARAYIGARDPAGRLAWCGLERLGRPPAEPVDPDLLDIAARHYAVFGLPLPAERVTRWLTHPPAIAARALAFWQADALAGVLARAGIVADAADIRALASTPDEGELQSDLGILPRLMLHLGFAAPFDAWRASQLAS